MRWKIQPHWSTVLSKNLSLPRRCFFSFKRNTKKCMVLTLSRKWWRKLRSLRKLKWFKNYIMTSFSLSLMIASLALWNFSILIPSWPSLLLQKTTSQSEIQKPNQNIIKDYAPKYSNSLPSTFPSPAASKRSKTMFFKGPTNTGPTQEMQFRITSDSLYGN